MKILIIGGKGTIGKKVSDHFSKKHEVVIGGRNSGDIVVDIANSTSIETLFESIANIDAVVCIAGEAKWAAFDSMTEQDYYIGLKSKLMGQINLVRIGQNYLNPGGSFTLREKHQIQLPRNFFTAKNRPLDCRLADAQPACCLRTTHSHFLYRQSDPRGGPSRCPARHRRGNSGAPRQPACRTSRAACRHPESPFAACLK